MSSRFFTSIKYHFNFDEYAYCESDYYDSDDEIDTQPGNKKFFASSAVGSVPESAYSTEGESEYEVVNENEEADGQPEAERLNESQQRIKFRNEFLAKYMNASSDEEEDSGKRVVKSQKDKRAQILSELMEQSRDAFDKSSWALVETSLNKLSKLIMKTAVKEEIDDMLDLLEELEIRCKEITPQDIKEMPTSQSKAFSSLRQHSKKMLRSYLDNFSYMFAEKEQEQEEQIDSEAESTVEKRSDKHIDKQKPMDSADILKQINQILISRGKKGTNNSKLLASLKEFLPGSLDYIQVRIYVAMLAILLDYNQNYFAYLPIAVWKETFGYLKTLLELLRSNSSSIRLKENIDEFSVSVVNGIQLVKGNFISFLGKVNDEFFKSLLFLDPFSPEYADRLKDEEHFVELLQHTIDYFNSIQAEDIAESVSFKLMEHLYYKQNCLDTLIGLYTSITKRCRMTQFKKNLFMLYAYALNGKIDESEKLLSIVRNEDLRDFDSSFHVLFNRCLVQYGLLCFSCERFKEAFECLGEIFNSSIKPKELIGQSFKQYSSLFLSTSAEKNSDERQERLKQVPHHMHISLDYIELVFFMASFLFEVGYVFDGKRKIQGRGLKKSFESMDKNMYSVNYYAPKDIIVSSVRHFLAGNWVLLESELSNLKFWQSYPASTKSAFFFELKVQFLKFYMQTFVSSNYATFNMNLLREHLNIDSDNTFNKLLINAFGQEMMARLVENSMILNVSTSEQFNASNNPIDNCLGHLAERSRDIVNAMSSNI